MNNPIAKLRFAIQTQGQRTVRDSMIRFRAIAEELAALVEEVEQREQNVRDLVWQLHKLAFFPDECKDKDYDAARLNTQCVMGNVED